MGSPAKCDPSSSTSPIVSIDLRRGSVEMQHGGEVWRGTLPINPGDISKVSVWRLTCPLARQSSEQLPELAA